MKERRSLVEGLKTDPEMQKLEEEFVFGAKRRSEPAIEPVEDEPSLPKVSEEAPPAAAPPALLVDRTVLPQISGRVPVTTRCTPEVASALKRASLQRQLAGVEPYYVQDIMEEALEQWLRGKGYV